MTLCVFFQLKESFYNKRNNLSWCDISEIWVLCHGLKKDLGGWPICLKSMVIDIKWEAKPFFSKSKGRKSYFFNVTPWRSVQIWGDLLVCFEMEPHAVMTIKDDLFSEQFGNTKDRWIILCFFIQDLLDDHKPWFVTLLDSLEDVSNL